jgi:hypothetical protein
MRNQTAAAKKGSKSQKKETNTAKRPRKESTPTANIFSFPFPLRTLEEAIKVAQAINESFAGKPTIMPNIAQALGMAPSNISFRRTVEAAKQYGLIVGSSVKAPVKLSTVGVDIVAPTSPEQRQKALLEAFSTVELFKKVADFYSGKPLPEYEFFKNILIREFGVNQGLASIFISIFTRFC